MKEKIKELLSKNFVSLYPNRFDNISDELITLIFDNLIEYLKENNPYPEKVFIEPSKDHLHLAIRLFNENGISVDGYNGSMGRFARNGMIRQIEEFKSMFED